MYNTYNTYPYPYLDNMYNPYNAYSYPYPYYYNNPMYLSSFMNNFAREYIPYDDEMECYPRHGWGQSPNNYNSLQLKDYGGKPFVINIEEATKLNNNFRTALWTGEHLQLTLMSINVGEDIGLEVHPNTDQFIRIEEGQGIVKMGDSKSNLYFQKNVYDNFAIIIPAGKWHNLINTGNKPIKLYSIYAPPQHPYGTIHETKAIAEAAEENHSLNYEKLQISSNKTREFTLSELAQYDGTMGKPAYVAVNGIVYDVTNNFKWSGGKHYNLTAGKDLTSEFQTCHGIINLLENLPNVGILIK